MRAQPHNDKRLHVGGVWPGLLTLAGYKGNGRLTISEENIVINRCAGLWPAFHTMRAGGPRTSI
jgi:hypothetical protein